MEYQHLTPHVAIERSAAFDTADHDVLLHVLVGKSGINYIALEWLDSYLETKRL